MKTCNSLILLGIATLFLSCASNSNQKAKNATQSTDSKTPQIEITDEVVVNVDNMDDETASQIAKQITAFYKTYGEHMYNDDERGVKKFLNVSPDFETPKDYDVYSQSQDPYDSYKLTVKKSTGHKNGFDVTWKDAYDSFHLVWLFVYDDGVWMLNDILED